MAAALTCAVGAVAAAIRRRRRAARANDVATPPTRQRSICVCGQEYDVAGADRHRVYWKAGAAEDDPVLGQDCPACGEPLSVERAAVG